MGISCPSSVLKSKRAKATSRFLMSFLKNNKTALSVPMCRMISKRAGIDELSKCLKISRCPVLEMGSHSVKPCIMLRITVCISWSKRQRLLFLFYSGFGLKINSCNLLICMLVICMADYLSGSVEDREIMARMPDQMLFDLFFLQIRNLWRVDGLYFLGIEQKFGFQIEGVSKDAFYGQECKIP